MNIRKREGISETISLKLDYPNYKLLLNDLKDIGQEMEYNSNNKKLDYSVIINANKVPYMKVKGWCSRVQDKKGKVSEVFFADYDNILYRIMESELLWLQEEYDLPPFYIFTTKDEVDNNGERYGNYLVVNLKKNTFKEVVDMQNQLHCDAAYKKIAMIYRFKTWVLRLGPKGKKAAPKFSHIIGNPKNTYKQEISGAHLAALESLYKIPKLKYLKNDGGTKKDLFVSEYVTASK